MSSAYDVLNKAKGLWGEIVALQTKIEFDERKRELLAHAAEAKAKIETIISDLEALNKKDLGL
ncbi:hypothetical protein [Mesorhizobium sp. AA22]|uniref:hypothetical protein n=1 Tax=Mesorhizobium sp. AA22 TaxID=1854057 RepID=UPI0007EC3AF3|nr:hypothetical protein [Mesorhizobium sp. AA22]QIA23099.1 hypothetical protein A9K68_015950 [Mesorhizobium sp. AA22]